MRVGVLKTYKIYIGGKFPRTESGRYYSPEINGEKLGNICLSSRKDFRNAVVAARKAQTGWAGATAYNRSQVIYRIAEMLEGRRSQFIEELKFQGSTVKQAEKEVDAAIDRLIYYAGWADKFSQIFSSVNPVASSHFNFTSPEPMGVVAILADEATSLIGLISLVAPVIVSGNTCVILASESKPLCSVTFAEVLNSSDVPGGVVNILTGKSAELSGQFASHMDVNALLYGRDDEKEFHDIELKSVENLKRVRRWSMQDPYSSSQDSPYRIEEFLEMKTTWHPIEKISSSGPGY